jgi:hypothetical protein
VNFFLGVETISLMAILEADLLIPFGVTVILELLIITSSTLKFVV